MKTFLHFSEDIQQRRIELRQRQLQARQANQERIAAHQEQTKQRREEQLQKREEDKRHRLELQRQRDQIKQELQGALQTEQVPFGGGDPTEYNRRIAAGQLLRKSRRELHAQQEMSTTARQAQAAKRKRISAIMNS